MNITRVTLLPLVAIVGLALPATGQDHPTIVPSGDTPEEVSFAPEKETVPGAYPVSRYERLWNNSLFGEGTKEVVAASSNLSLIGLYELEGVRHAVLMDTASGLTEDINDAKPSASGRRLTKIENASDQLKTRVQVERGGSLMWVAYNPNPQNVPKPGGTNPHRPTQPSGPVMQGAGGKIDKPGSSSGGSKPRTVVLPSTIPVAPRQE